MLFYERSQVPISLWFNPVPEDLVDMMDMLVRLKKLWTILIKIFSRVMKQ